MLCCAVINAGYSEQQYSLPRWTDLTVSRQGLLDDVWLKPAVMGWMFLPMKPVRACVCACVHARSDQTAATPAVSHVRCCCCSLLSASLQVCVVGGMFVVPRWW